MWFMITLNHALHTSSHTINSCLLVFNSCGALSKLMVLAVLSEGAMYLLLHRTMLCGHIFIMSMHTYFVWFPSKTSYRTDGANCPPQVLKHQEVIHHGPHTTCRKEA